MTARDLSVYQPLVEAIFPRYQIPVFTSAMTDILDKPILTLVTAALDTVANGYRYDDVSAIRPASPICRRRTGTCWRTMC